jgi:hypothetical protein
MTKLRKAESKSVVGVSLDDRIDVESRLYQEQSAVEAVADYMNVLAADNAPSIMAARGFENIECLLLVIARAMKDSHTKTNELLLQAREQE